MTDRKALNPNAAYFAWTEMTNSLPDGAFINKADFFGGILAYLAAIPASADGAVSWRLVPVEPTEAMIEAFYHAEPVVGPDRIVSWSMATAMARGNTLKHLDERLQCAYRAMLAVAPSPTSAGAEWRDTGHHKLDTDKQVFFYEQDFYVLSNFSAFSIVFEGTRHATSEHAYHWMKFIDVLEGQRVCQDVHSARSAHDAFKIAERNKHCRRPDWDDVKINIMRNILRAKAEQHEYVRRKLLATGDRELVEDSWRDDFWGWGPNRDGQNMLGKLWMEVRAELRALPAPPVSP